MLPMEEETGSVLYCQIVPHYVTEFDNILKFLVIFVMVKNRVNLKLSGYKMNSQITS